jgi:oxygen-dependent protoporphyrinogen oxidase
MLMQPTKIRAHCVLAVILPHQERMAAEWFHPPHKASEDETVAELVERHYGPEMVDRLADPLLSGVYGGEASRLSVRAVLSRFADMEAKHVSLGRAMLSARKKMVAAANGPPPLFTSLKDGMQQMVDAPWSRLRARSLRTTSPVGV